MTICAWGLDFKYDMANGRSGKGSALLPYFLSKQKFEDHIHIVIDVRKFWKNDPEEKRRDPSC